MDNVRERQKVVLWVAIVAAVVVIAGATVAAFALWGDRSEPAPATPDPLEDAASDGCTGVEAQSIELDGQIVEPKSRTCFELTETLQVNIGAAALEPSDLIELVLFDSEGKQLAAAVSEPDWDPTIGIELVPGTYIIEVVGVDTEDAPPFLLHTATFPPSGQDESAPGTEILPGGEDLPALDACGAQVPWLATGEPVSVSQRADALAEDAATGTESFACVDVSEAVFAKIGIESADPYAQDAADFTLAVYRLSADGAELFRIGDDAFGADPEVSLDLEPGVYLVEGATWHGAPAGEFEFYYDDQATLFREGEVSPMHADLDSGFCDDESPMQVGDSMTVEGERAYTCLEVAEGGRLTIQAATLTDQDLTLEVIGFNDAGPYRLAWTDDNPHSQALIDFDPLLDQYVPAGVWVVAVTSYYGDVGADYDLRAVTGGGPGA